MDQNTKYVVDRLRKVADGSAPTPSLQVLARQGADAIEGLDAAYRELEAQLTKPKQTRRKPAAKAEGDGEVNED